MQKDYVIECERPFNPNHHPHMMEVGQRLRYINNAIKQMKSLGVEYIGSVGREQMTKELKSSQVFAYPCSIVNDYTESLSVATLEACAAGCVPII